jgi:hypothetical protein
MFIGKSRLIKICAAHNRILRKKREREREKKPYLEYLPIISSFIFSRFSSANGCKRRMVLLAWSFEGSNSKIFFISTSKSENKINYKIPSFQHTVQYNASPYNPRYSTKLTEDYQIQKEYNGLTIILNPNLPAIASS